MCCIRRIKRVSGVAIATLIVSVLLAVSAFAEYETFDPHFTAEERIQLALWTLQDALNGTDPMAVEDLAAVAEDATRDDLSAVVETLRSTKGVVEDKAVFSLAPMDYRAMGDGFSVGVKVMVQTGAGIVSDTVTLNVRGDSTHISLLGLAKVVEEVSAFLSEGTSQDFLTAGAESAGKFEHALNISDYESPHLLMSTDLYPDAGVERLSATTSQAKFGGPIFSRPYGLLSFSYHDPVGSYSFLITTDADADRVMAAEPDRHWLKAVGRYGTGASGFSQPTGVAWAMWKFYVADSHNDRVKVYSVNPAADPAEITYDTCYQDSFDTPIDVAADVYKVAGWPYRQWVVLDQGNKRIRLYSECAGQELLWYPNDTVQFNLWHPTAIALGRHPTTHAPTQSCYVADNGTSANPGSTKRIVGFEVQTPYPTGVAAWSTPVNTFPDDAFLSSVCCDNYGRVYALDGHNSVVYKFTASLQLVGKFGSCGTGAQQLLHPVRMTIPRHWYVPYSGPSYYSDMGDALVTEMFGANSGVRRYVQGFDVLAQRADYVPRPSTGQQDYIEMHWFQSGSTIARFKLFKSGNSHAIGEVTTGIVPPGDRALQCAIPDSIPDTCTLVAYLDLTTIYDEWDNDTTLADTLDIIRHVCTPCDCAIDRIVTTVTDALTGEHLDTCLYANRNSLFKVTATPERKCGTALFGPYVWYIDTLSTIPSVQWSSGGKVVQPKSGYIVTEDNCLYFRIPYLPEGWVPAMGGSLVVVRVRFEGDTLLPRGEQYPCGWTVARVAGVYWSRCQSLCVDSCADCCTGWSVGNVDGSADHYVAMSDLTVLIDHLFGSMQPLPCPTSGNMDMSQDGLVTMGDLTVLIDHLFIELKPLSPCPY